MYSSAISPLLGRNGKISIVQISTPTRCFLLDVLDKDSDDRMGAATNLSSYSIRSTEGLSVSHSKLPPFN